MSIHKIKFIKDIKFFIVTPLLMVSALSFGSVSSLFLIFATMLGQNEPVSVPIAASEFDKTFDVIDADNVSWKNDKFLRRFSDFTNTGEGWMIVDHKAGLRTDIGEIYDSCAEAENRFENVELGMGLFTPYNLARIRASNKQKMH